MFEATILVSTLYKVLAGGGAILVTSYAWTKLILRTAIEFDDEFIEFKELHEAKIEAAIKAETKGSAFRKIKREVSKSIAAERKRLIELKLAEKGISKFLKKLRKNKAEDVVREFSDKFSTKTSKTATVDKTVTPEKEEPAKTATSNKKKKGKASGPAIAGSTA